ncbi:MAG TPA: poly-beta-hydroxybutyrate polymerase, partial [Acidimicrobiia bacterium]|nr:poly-beta-hydroxybutyrate polymerase [Acidimicrobiia bacterium]
MAVSETSGKGNGRGRATSRRTLRPAPLPGPETNFEPLDVGARAAEILAPEGGLAALDPVAFGKALTRFGTEVARRPVPTVRAITRLGTGLALSGVAAAGRAGGLKLPGALPAPPPKDRRFADPAWESNAAYFALLQSYRLFDRFVDELLDLAELEEPWRGKARFVLRMAVDATAPTNFLFGNPAALKKAFDTGGLSLVRGFRNFVTDLTTNGGLPRKVDRSAFTLGQNLAATPGKVVFRNDLMELIQYEPQTDTVHEIPILCSPPWINKYYVMDLAPGRSFVEWAVKHGHTVFQISYRNPGKDMSHVRLDDYLIDGPRQALDVIHEITGSPTVNMVGLCLGG